MATETIKRKCSVEWCERKHFAIGYCNMHYIRLRKGQDMDAKPYGSKGEWGDWLTLKSGYVRRNRTRPDGSQEQQLQHHAVMEEMLGRKLLPGENVHHKNAIRNDNRPENLELWSGSQPAGARVDDKIEWAIWFLEQYGYGVLPPVE